MLKGLLAELLVWLMALCLLAFSNPNSHHFTLCLLKNLGISWCSGCGIGRSIAYLLQGDPLLSLRTHWFGIPSVLILVGRVYDLSRKIILNLNSPNSNSCIRI